MKEFILYYHTYKLCYIYLLTEHLVHHNKTKRVINIMEVTLELPMFFIALIFLISVILVTRNNSKPKPTEAPEPAGAWPIIGHLHLLGGAEPILYRTLAAMADKYGPAFNLRLGMRPAFVVSNWEVAKECFTVHDKVFATRPKLVAFKHLGYNFGVFGLAPNSPYWREMRMFTNVEILSARRLEILKDVRSSEIDFGIKELYRRWSENCHRPVVVELIQWVEDVLFNITVMLIAGKRYFGAGFGGDEAARFQKAMSEFFRLMGAFVVGDTIPFLAWLDLEGYERDMKKAAKELDFALGRWLDEHRQKRKLGFIPNKGDEKDFIDVMLSREEEGQFSNFQHDSSTIIKATCMALVIGGSESPMMTLIWAISLLLNHPDVLKKLQEELDLQVGKNRRVEESDIKNLTFLHAIIKETLRMYPSPLLGPREAREDCTVAGYNVKAGTRLVVNVWKIQRDPTVWTDPSKFQPERFMGLDHEHVDLRGRQFVLMPFGSGRRSCPGLTLGLQIVHLTLARLVHEFELAKPEGRQIDMTENPGLNMTKKEPLKVIITPRLPSKLYGY